MKVSIALLLLLFCMEIVYAQMVHTLKSPKELRSTLGEFVTESPIELHQRTWQVHEFKTKDGGTATLLKFDFPESLPVTKHIRSELKIFPNPASGIFHITVMNAASENGRIEIFNVLGVRVLTISLKNLKETDVDLLNFPSGVYVLKCFTGNEILTQRIIKE